MNLVNTIFFWCAAGILGVFILRLIDQITEAIKSKGMFWRLEAKRLEFQLKDGTYNDVRLGELPARTLWPESFTRKERDEDVMVQVKHGVGGHYACIEIKSQHTSGLKWKLLMLESALTHHATNSQTILSTDAKVFLSDFICEVKEANEPL